MWGVARRGERKKEGIRTAQKPRVSTSVAFRKNGNGPNDAHLLCHLNLCPDERRHLESGTFRRLFVGHVAREGCEPGSLVRLLVEFLDERFRRRCELLRAQEREEVDVRLCFRTSSARSFIQATGPGQGDSRRIPSSIFGASLALLCRLTGCLEVQVERVIEPRKRTVRARPTCVPREKGRPGKFGQVSITS